ncbi:MAG: ABC transporter permease [Clostridia bacterium]|nr:ABC transporter permease [Clostridia bacterium]
MKKELLLAKSNIRKGKGITVGLILLIILAAAFFNLVLVIFNDVNKNVNKCAERLNTEDVNIQIAGDISSITDEYIESIINKNNVKDYELLRANIFYAVVTKYGDGEVTPNIVFEKKDSALNARIGKSEIVEEDNSISGIFIYLPYQYHTGGKFNLGDEFKVTILGKEYTFKIKGFINNITMGSYNTGDLLMIVDDDTYNDILVKNNNTYNYLRIKTKVNENVNKAVFGNDFLKTITSKDNTLSVYSGVIDDYIFGRTFIALIIGVSFLAFSLIILVIVFLMLSNSISNYIKENIETIGAIKAIGFTSKNIKVSFMLQFAILSVIGTILGLGLSYLMIPFITGIITTQVGIPYNVVFNPVVAVTTIVTLIAIIIISVLFFTRKTKKIEPITALRDGISTHNFKKNKIPIETSKLPININLAIKTMFINMKQNIITFIVVFFLVFNGVISLIMMQNFSIKPKISLLTFELCDGAIFTDEDKDKEVFEYIKSLDHVKNVRLISNESVEADNTTLSAYILNNDCSLKNIDVCYKGRLPQYNNEVALSGKYCENYNHSIGDEIEIGVGNQKAKYIITGFIQTTNNNGQEAVIREDGAHQIFKKDFKKLYYFDVDEGTNIDDCLDNIKNRFGDKIGSTVNFQKVIDGSITIFKTISNMMVVAMIAIGVLIILLVLYLLIKTLINNKRKEYGILKAIGYTSKDVILQNAISFMPSIILSVIISCFISSKIANPYLTMMMSSFGIMKATFEVPVTYVAVMGVGFIVISFLFAVLLSRKIRKIEAYNLLRGE